MSHLKISRRLTLMNVKTVDPYRASTQEVCFSLNLNTTQKLGVTGKRL